MRVNEVGTDAELLSVDRPCSCSVGPCKCCCYQNANFSSNSNPLGSIHEACYFCVPMFHIRDPSGKTIYKIHPPTCCPGGFCVNCCTEGNPFCGRGCCVMPFWVFDPDTPNTNGSDAPHLGKIVKRPKSIATEIFTDANAFEVQFPDGASVENKAMLVGASIFLNANFFEARESS
jgi:Scramblase